MFSLIIPININIPIAFPRRRRREQWLSNFLFSKVIHAK